MTVIAVLADPPREGLVLPGMAASSPLSSAEAVRLYEASLRDVLVAAARSGGDLLVNYRPDDLLPDEFVGERRAEAEVRAVAADVLADLDEVRFEPQVGSTFAARAGNTVTHLLREEDEGSVAVVRPSAAFLTRSAIDSAAMKLRSAGTVLGPSTTGRTYYAAFSEPIDFTDAFATPEVETLTARAGEADHDVDFLPVQPVLERGGDLATAIPLLRARSAAGRLVPTHTAGTLADLDLTVEPEDDGDAGGLRVVRGSNGE
jgi:hypothetical protein